MKTTMGDKLNNEILERLKALGERKGSFPHAEHTSE